MAIQLDIVTPVKRILSVQTEAVNIPGYQGELGVLSEHSAMISVIECGLVKFSTADGAQVLAVRGGFAELQAKKVLLLVDEVMSKETFKRDDAELKLKNVQEKLVAAEVGYDERAGLLKERDWLQACLSL